MGYRTYYTLQYIDPAGDELPEGRQAEIMAYIENAKDHDGWPTYEIDEAEAKWYEHDQDMAVLSKAFPDVLFCLHGEGEDNQDMWETYYFAGKMQYCEAMITYAPFDPAKLKEVQ